MSLPSVTCICPTYGRFPNNGNLLNECVYWFTRQTYQGKMTLLIVNDAREQRLVCDVPSVRVVNVPIRFASLGAKYNAMLSMCDSDIVLPWEDDDIGLPNRISQAVEHLRGIYEYWNPKGAFFQNGPNAELSLCNVDSVHHNASAFRRIALIEHRLKYPAYGPDGCKQDAWMDRRLREVAKLNSVRLSTPSEYTYVYRWGVSNVGHLSANPDPTVAYTVQPVPIEGTYEITPTMFRDYAKEASRFVALCNASRKG